MQVCLLPQFALAVDGHIVDLCSRAERVLTYLALQGGTARRITIAGTLWPDCAGERALSSLRTALWNLSRMDIPVVHVSPTAVSIRAEVGIDLHQATERARDLIDGRCDLADVRATTRLLRHGLLIDWAEDWVIVPQEQFRQLRLHALEALAEELLAAGRYAQSVVAGLDAVACEPLRETSHLLLMKAFIAQGNRGAAINQYRSCRHLLRDELGLEPSDEMDMLIRQTLGSRAEHDGVVTVA